MKKQRWNIVFIIAAFAALLLFVVLTCKPEQMLVILKNARLPFLGAAFLCMAAYWLLETWMLQAMTSTLSRPLKFRQVLRVSMVGQLFNQITPFSSGGQPIQAYYLCRYGVPLGSATSILLMKFIVYQTVLALYSLVLLVFQFPFFLQHVAGFGWLILIGFAVNLAVVVLLYSVGYFPGGTRRFLLWLLKVLHKMRIVKDRDKMEHRILDEMEKFHQDFVGFKGHPKEIIRLVVFSFLQLTVFFLVPLCVCLALNAGKVSALSVVSAAAFVLLISSFVPLPGASGGAEGSFYLLFGIFFVQPEGVPMAILMWRMLTFYLPILTGVFFAKLPKKFAAPAPLEPQEYKEET